jgi:Glycosyl transferase family 2
VKLAMTMVVRDGGDVLADNIRFHAAQGVDLFVIADHLSTDDSLEVARRYERLGLVDLHRLEGPVQDIWDHARTRLARRARELGADWVINNDQDEFWWPLAGNLKDAFATVPEEFGVLVAPRADFVARPGKAPYMERMTYRESRFLRPPKAAHRAHPAVVLDQPHPTRISHEQGFDVDAFGGRPGIDDVSREVSPAELALVWAPVFPIRILHFPIRSLDQYRRRVEVAAAEGMLEVKDRGAVREAHEAGRVEALYDELAFSDEQVSAALADGTLVEDRDLVDYLATCAEPGQGEPRPATESWTEERRQRELERLAFEGMYGITRYARRHAVRRGIDVSRRKVRELRTIKRSLWWRMRPRIPAALRRNRR